MNNSLSMPKCFAATATQALEVFASGEPVDVIFTDVQMPGAMDGLMLLRWYVSITPVSKCW
jgi:CheY-like chemotaxis protein